MERPQDAGHWRRRTTLRWQEAGEGEGKGEHMKESKHRLASATSPEFKRICADNDIPQTRRQWKKFQRGFGKANALRNQSRAA